MHPKGVFGSSSSAPRFHTNGPDIGLLKGDSLSVPSQSIGHTWIPLTTTESVPGDVLQKNISAFLAEKLNRVMGSKLKYNLPTFKMTYRDFPVALPADEFLAVLKNCPPLTAGKKIPLHLIIKDVEEWPGFSSEAIAFFLNKVTQLSLVGPNFERLADLEFQGPDNQILRFNSAVLKRVFRDFEIFFGDVEKEKREKTRIFKIPTVHEYRSLFCLCNYSLTIPFFSRWSKDFSLEELTELYENMKKWKIEELCILLKKAIREKIKLSDIKDFDLTCNFLAKTEFYEDIIQAGIDKKAKDLDVESKTRDVAPKKHLYSLKELAFWTLVKKNSFSCN